MTYSTWLPNNNILTPLFHIIIKFVQKLILVSVGYESTFSSTFILPATSLFLQIFKIRKVSFHFWSFLINGSEIEYILSGNNVLKAYLSLWLLVYTCFKFFETDFKWYSPVLCVCSIVVEVVMSVLQSSSLMPVLLESRQITSCLADFTSCCETAEAADDDTCFVMSSREKRENHGVGPKGSQGQKIGKKWGEGRGEKKEG